MQAISLAIKPSKVKKGELINLNRKIHKYFDYFVIDAEKEPLKDEDVIDNLKNAVITVQSKRRDVYDLLEFYSSYDIDLCIVLGNKSYLSVDERKFRRDRILEVIEKALEYRDTIWVGTEGVEDLVASVIEDKNLIAYYLYGATCDLNAKKAVYVPFATKVNENTLLSIRGYLERRKSYKGNWKDFLLSLSDVDNQVIENLKQNDIIVGYPIVPTVDEILKFKEVMGV